MNYDAPKSAVKDPIDERPPGKVHAFFAVTGALLSALIFIGIGAFAYTLYGVFYAMPAEAAADPRLIAGGISKAMVLASVYGLLSSVGLIVSVATLSVTPYRKKWFVRSTVFSAIAALLFFPIGTAIGIVTLAIIYKKRREIRQVAESGYGV